MLSLGRVVTSSQLALRGLFVRISSADQVFIGHDWSLTCAEAGHSDVHLVNRDRLLRIRRVRPIVITRQRKALPNSTLLRTPACVLLPIHVAVVDEPYNL
jgi:hypothetical protein